MWKNSRADVASQYEKRIQMQQSQVTEKYASNMRHGATGENRYRGSDREDLMKKPGKAVGCLCRGS
jgi:hypothetical protein